MTRTTKASEPSPRFSAVIDVAVMDGDVTVEVGKSDQYTMLNGDSIVPK